jgi:hypothetical protein
MSKKLGIYTLHLVNIKELSTEMFNNESFHGVRQFRLDQDRPKARFTVVRNRNVLLRFRFGLWKSLGSGSGSGKFASHLFFYNFFITFYVGSGSAKAKSYGSCCSYSGSNSTLLFTLFSLVAGPLTDLSRTTTLTRFLMMRLKASLAEEQKFVLWKIQYVIAVYGI